MSLFVLNDFKKDTRQNGYIWLHNVPHAGSIILFKVKLSVVLIIQPWVSSSKSMILSKLSNSVLIDKFITFSIISLFFYFLIILT